MRNKARRKGERFIEFRAIGVVVFDLNKFMVVVSFSLVVDPATAGLKEGENAERWLFASNPGFRLRWIKAKTSTTWQGKL